MDSTKSTKHKKNMKKRMMEKIFKRNNSSLSPDCIKSILCIIYAHIENIAKPGSFNTTINEVFKLNNIPELTFPTYPPSLEILDSISKNLPDFKTLPSSYAKTKNCNSDSRMELSSTPPSTPPRTPPPQSSKSMKKFN